jgi:hypothetical protein
MRLWSIHPKYLDRQGLIALWREALLAQKVLSGKTKGYRNHPQLERFKRHTQPLLAISRYLEGIYREAKGRGYHFDKNKILFLRKKIAPIWVSSGQARFEYAHLKKKLSLRHGRIPARCKKILLHPFFKIRKGKKDSWEKG